MINRTRRRTGVLVAAFATTIGLAGCGQDSTTLEPVATATAAATTAGDAADFLARANAGLSTIARETSAAGWVSSTYINGDTALLSSKANARKGTLINSLIDESRAWDDVDVDAATRRDLVARQGA